MIRLDSLTESSLSPKALLKTDGFGLEYEIAICCGLAEQRQMAKPPKYGIGGDLPESENNSGYSTTFVFATPTG